MCDDWAGQLEQRLVTNNYSIYGNTEAVSVIYSRQRSKIVLVQSVIFQSLVNRYTTRFGYGNSVHPSQLHYCVKV